jgi:hypothetical protein
MIVDSDLERVGQPPVGRLQREAVSKLLVVTREEKTMTLPRYSAEASLGRSNIAYTTRAVGHRGSSRGAIVPADNCSSVNCDEARDFCYASLDLDPVSCGLYYGCCQGAGRTGGDLGGPQPDIPPSPGLPLTAVDPTLGAGLSDLRSQITSLGNQLKKIAVCACPSPHHFTRAFVPVPRVSVFSPPVYYPRH